MDYKNEIIGKILTEGDVVIQGSLSLYIQNIISREPNDIDILFLDIYKTNQYLLENRWVELMKIINIENVTIQNTPLFKKHFLPYLNIHMETILLKNIKNKFVIWKDNIKITTIEYCLCTKIFQFIDYLSNNTNHIETKRISKLINCINDLIAIESYLSMSIDDFILNNFIIEFLEILAKDLTICFFKTKKPDWEILFLDSYKERIEHLNSNYSELKNPIIDRINNILFNEKIINTILCWLNVILDKQHLIKIFASCNPIKYFGANYIFLLKDWNNVLLNVINLLTKYEIQIKDSDLGEFIINFSSLISTDIIEINVVNFIECLINITIRRINEKN